MIRLRHMKLCWVILLLAIAGCERPATRQTADGTGDARRTLEIKGSDTMVNLGAAWSEAIKADRGIVVNVTGGGSGTGIKAMIEGNTDIAASSREMKEKEIQLAKQNNVNPVEHVVGMDGIAVVVHPENPLDELTMEQLRKIYIGQITNWNQVGGADRAILVMSRESNSGTYVFFQEHVLQNEDYRTDALLSPSSAHITQNVQQDASAIGYVGVAYAENTPVRILKIRPGAASQAVTPSVATVQDGTYPIARPLLLYTNGEPAGTVKEFLDFALSPKGQEIVLNVGYIPLPNAGAIE